MEWDFRYQDTFYSELQPAEALRRLQSSLVPADAPIWRDDCQPPAGHFFQGSVEGDTLSILRLPTAGIPVRRDAGPFPIQGRIQNSGSGSCISLQVRLVPGSWALVLFQLGMMGTIVAGVSAAVWYSTKRFPWFGLGVVGVLQVFWATGMYLTLLQEAARSRPLLLELLKSVDDSQP